MAYLAYIIGEIPNVITIKCRQQFANAQALLEEKGFRVINPIKNLDNNRIKFEDATKRNIRLLTDCNVVYLLPSVSLENVKSAELLLAIKLNMLIIQDSIILEEDEVVEESIVLQD